MKTTIKMVAMCGSTRVELTETYLEDTGWQAIAYQFQKFLDAQGYRVDSDYVGADVGAYINSVDKESSGNV